MDSLKLIIACAIIIGLTQLGLDGGAPQRKYYTGRQVIEQRQAAAAAGTLPQTPGSVCSGGSCPFTPKPKPLPTEEQQAEEQARQQAEEQARSKKAEHDALTAQIDALKKDMAAQAARLQDLEEKLQRNQSN